MATVIIKEPREQEAHFGLYRTSAGGDESIIVRRKVGEPTDYIHGNSRKLARQREILTLASQHYAHLTPSQKAITRRQIEEVEYQKSHGKTDTKLLMGRQLFIAKEIRSLKTTGKQLLLPHELCIMLVDENLSPLEGELWLSYLNQAEWWSLAKEEIATGNWLFSLVPPAQEAYWPYGVAEGYFDPMLPEYQFMSEDEILPYHYHVLLLPVASEIIVPCGDGDLTELYPEGIPHWPLVLEEDAVWIPPNGGGPWGYFTGNFVSAGFFPYPGRTDLYTFTQPLYAAQYIYKLTVHSLLGRDVYPYGDAKIVLKTHGQLHYSEEFHPNWPKYWVEASWELNPETNQVWTREELLSLQIGIWMAKRGSFGRIICDKLFAKLFYS